jgi:GDP-4-dehydro-6-deoxy-D-mannose reductase
MRRILITGATGFVGRHLVEHLSSQNSFEIYGTSLSDSKTSDKINLEKIDLQDSGLVQVLIEKIKPDQIYHLAAFTSPADSFQNPTPVVLGNIEIQMNVLNALRKLEMFSTKVLVVSSGEVYGMVEQSDLPIDEGTRLQPANPYAVSKVAQDFLGLQYSLSYKMDIVRVRPFNHIGPGQSSSFAVSAFSEQIAKIEKEKQEPVMKVGNLSAKRDFTDVRDIVRGYALLMEKGEKGEVYNIGSGESKSTKALLDALLSLTDKKIIVEEDPARMRPIEVAEVCCDYSKLNSLTGWKPEIPLEKALKDTLDYWREIV